MRPWSYSRLSTYTDCPAQYNYKYVERAEGHRPDSPAASRGSDLHSAAEAYLKDELKIYPPEFQRISGHCMLLKSKGAQSEAKLAVKEDWTPTEYDSADVYFRAIIDVIYVDENVLHIQDWKTGQVYPSHAVQLEKYVAVAAAHYPEATEYRTRLLYIDQGVVTPAKVTLPVRLKPIRMMIDGEIKNAESDEIYPTRSGQHCRWCDYSKKFGGPCKF